MRVRDLRPQGALKWQSACSRSTVNGRPREDAVADNALLLDYLRDQLGLTGTKQGCDGGECGACTVLVDGEPRLSCITLAASVRGSAVETIEAWPRPGA